MLTEVSHFVRQLLGIVLVQLTRAVLIEGREGGQPLLLCDLANPNEHLDRDDVLPINGRAPATAKRPDLDRRSCGHYGFENRRRTCSSVALFFGLRAAFCASERRRFPAGLRARRTARPIKDAIHTLLASFELMSWRQDGRRTPLSDIRWLSSTPLRANRSGRWVVVGDPFSLSGGFAKPTRGGRP
jgi:hypothetical protein